VGNLWPGFRLGFWFLGLLGALSLTSCLSLDVKVKIDPSLGGTLEASMLVSELAQGLEPRLPNGQEVKIPSTEAGWRTLVQGVKGVVLTSFSGSEEALGRRVNVKLSFSGPRALREVFALFGQEVDIGTDAQNLTQMTVVWATPNLVKAARRLQSLWNAYWGKNTWVFDVETPKRLISQTDGARPAENHVIWTVKESALTQSPPPYLKLTW
jgi:hypothetical protein